MDRNKNGIPGLSEAKPFLDIKQFQAVDRGGDSLNSKDEYATQMRDDFETADQDGNDQLDWHSTAHSGRRHEELDQFRYSYSSCNPRCATISRSLGLRRANTHSDQYQRSDLPEDALPGRQPFSLDSAVRAKQDLSR